jgi:hypothetical protein
MWGKFGENIIGKVPRNIFQVRCTCCRNNTVPGFVDQSYGLTGHYDNAAANVAEVSPNEHLQRSLPKKSTLGLIKKSRYPP